MPPIQCNNKKIIDGLEWYCNRDAGHEGDHEYNVFKRGVGIITAKRWKQ